MKTNRAMRKNFFERFNWHNRGRAAAKINRANDSPLPFGDVPNRRGVGGEGLYLFYQRLHISRHQVIQPGISVEITVRTDMMTEGN